MAKRNSTAAKGRHIHEAGADAVEAARAEQAGTEFEWHPGRLTRMGTYAPGGRTVTIVWEEGGVSSHQGDITDDQWDLFRLAFQTTGRVAVLSDRGGDDWMHDYRFLEVVR